MLLDESGSYDTMVMYMKFFNFTSSLNFRETSASSCVSVDVYMCMCMYMCMCAYSDNSKGRWVSSI